MKWFGILSVSLFVAGVSVLVANLPAHRPLDWNREVIPLAQTYADKLQEETPTQAANPNSPLQDAVIVVTGTTSGIGYSLTKALTKLGATVVALGRSKSKFDRLQQELQKQQPSASIFPVQADLSDLGAVATAARSIVQRFPRIDVLINNAGAHDGFGNLWGRSQSAQGHDTIFAVNYLSHVLLTEVLAPALNASSSPIVLQVSSSYHWGVDGSDLVPTMTHNSNNDDKATIITTAPPLASQVGGSHGFVLFRSSRSYSNSKLAQLWHARALKRHHPLLQQARVVSVCPGWVATQIVGGKNAVPSVIQDTVHSLAFESDGWGLSSLFWAMWDPTTSSDDGDDEKDFYINSAVLNQVVKGYEYLPRWAYATGLRDVLTFVMAMSLLLFQRLSPESLAITSSPESYQMEQADALYQWSLDVVKEYL